MELFQSSAPENSILLQWDIIIPFIVCFILSAFIYEVSKKICKAKLTYLQEFRAAENAAMAAEIKELLDENYHLGLMRQRNFNNLPEVKVVRTIDAIPYQLAA